MNKKTLQVTFGTGSDLWQTPPEFYDMLDKEFHFDFDPCPTNPTFDGLKRDWGRSNYVNPPYSQIYEWAQKCVDELLKGNTSVLLCFARTDTAWFHNIVMPNAREIRFIRGRLKFVGAPSSAPFPSMVVIFKPGEGLKIGASGRKV